MTLSDLLPTFILHKYSLLMEIVLSSIAIYDSKLPFRKFTGGDDSKSSIVKGSRLNSVKEIFGIFLYIIQAVGIIFS